jgi:predicted Co/Zn/Cd cation transporter (cation efflux family)
VCNTQSSILIIYFSIISTVQSHEEIKNKVTSVDGKNLRSSEQSRNQAVERQSLEVGKWGNLLMAGAGIAAAWTSHSDAILVDGLYSGVNFVAAIIAARISAAVLKPADRRYPFGYDSYEALYVKYRSLVLLGIITFAIFGAVSKIIFYASGGQVPGLVFGPIVIYMISMVVICFGLAAWHRYNWKRSGSRSELLDAESKAAIVDGVISAGAGVGLLAASLLRGTALEFIVPVADSIIVIVMSAFIIGQPMRMFLRSLREVAGESAEPEVLKKTLACTQELLRGRPWQALDVAVSKMGRSYLIISYLIPEQAIAANQVDALRHELEIAYANLLGEVKTEIIITAEAPYEDESSR